MEKDFASFTSTNLEVHFGDEAELGTVDYESSLSKVTKAEGGKRKNQSYRICLSIRIYIFYSKINGEFILCYLSNSPSLI